jgi:molybdopterin synthase sulfur carrier subunit
VIRIVLPAPLRALAQVGVEVNVVVEPPVTRGAVLDALEAQYPVLRGTIRDRHSRIRRPMLRFFACGQDLSHAPQDARLPEAVASGAEPLVIVGAIAGG